MLYTNCKRCVLWAGLLCVVFSSDAWAYQFRGQSFFGGNNRPSAPFGQRGGQSQFQSSNRFPGQPGQRPFQQTMPLQGGRQQSVQNQWQQRKPLQSQPFNLPQAQGQQQSVRKPQLPFQDSKVGQRLPSLGGPKGAGNPLRQGLPGTNQPLAGRNRPNLNLGSRGEKGTPFSKALDQRKNQGKGNFPFAGKPGGRQQPQVGKSALTDKFGKATKGGHPLLSNRRPLANPKPIRRSTDLKKFGIEIKPPQKLDQQRTGPRRTEHVARKFNLFNQNQRPNGPKLTKGIENKIEGVVNGRIRPNDPKIVQNFRTRKVDFADKLVAEAALRRFRANNPSAADLDLIQQLGGVPQLVACAATFVVMPDFCTDADVIEPIDETEGCILAAILEPVQTLEEGDDTLAAAYGISAPDDSLPLDSTEEEELAAEDQVQLIHPDAEGSDVYFSIDGDEQNIPPGTLAGYALPRRTKGEVRFDTGAGTIARYTLTAGETYEFYDKNGSLDLRKKLIEELPAETPRTNVAEIKTAQAETVVAATTSDQAAQLVADPVDTAPAEHADTETVRPEVTDEAADLSDAMPADAAAVSEATTSAPPVVRQVIGRFAVLNPQENEVELKFLVNGDYRSLAPGKVAILNVMGDATTVAFSTGEPEPEELVERTVTIGKAYEFWNNDGVWDLREKEIPQQRIASAAGGN